MSEIETIDQQLEILERQSHYLLQSISDIKYRHSLDGNRRNGQDRRSGQDRRGSDLTPERAAGRRNVKSDRRLPLHTRHETLSGQLSSIIARSVALQDWRQNLLSMNGT